MSTKIKNIVIVQHEPLTHNIRTRFMIDDLFKRGFKVQYWDVSQITKTETKGHISQDEVWVTRFSKMKDIHDLLLQISINETLFILEFYNNWKNIQLNKLFSNKNLNSIRIDLYANTIIPCNIIDRIRKFKSLRSMYSIIYNRSYKLFNLFFEIKPNIKDYFSSSAFSGRTRCINHPDYEAFKMRKEHNIYSSESKHILFIDVDFPCHPDLQIVYRYQYNNNVLEGYRDLMIRYFDYLEINYNLPVVIAAHPKSNYTGSEFGRSKIIKGKDRDIIIGKTVNLIAESEFVVNHFSTSFSFISLFNKPFSLLYTEYFDPIPNIRISMNQSARLLNSHVQYLKPDNFDSIKYEHLDEKIRQDYIYGYLTSEETKDSHNIDILCNYINENFK